MTRRTALAFSVFTPFASRLVAFAQEGGSRQRVSPHQTETLMLGQNQISISYGRPYLKGRQVGDEVAPFGKVWRLGADEATKITVTQATSLGDLKLAPGSYALFAVPGKEKWTMIVNKTANQWGAFDYEQGQDLGRFDVPVQQQAALEQFTIALQKQSETTAKLSFAWGPQMVSTTLKAA